MSGGRYTFSIADLVASEYPPEELPPIVHYFEKSETCGTKKSGDFKYEDASVSTDSQSKKKKKKKSKKELIQNLTEDADTTSAKTSRKRQNEEAEDQDIPLERKKKCERFRESDEAVPKKKKKDRKRSMVAENEFQSDNPVKKKKKRLEDQSHMEKFKEESANVGKKARHEKENRRSLLKNDRCDNDQRYLQNSFFDSGDAPIRKTRAPPAQEKDDDDDLEEGNTSTFSNVPKKKEKEREARTVFIGNVPVSHDKKKMKKLLSKFGSIEAIRFRSAPVSNPAYSKRISFITKDFKSDRRSVNCYVRFKSIKEAHGALAFSGTVIDGLTVRVDIASGKKSHDNSRAVFIGNVPFEAEEEELREEFCSCGEIEEVRIIRDPVTCVGKGFAYINFVSSDGAQLAMELDGKPMHGRTLRVKPCVKKVKAKPDQRNINTGGKKFKAFGATSKHGKQSRNGGRRFKAGKKRERARTTAPSYAGEQTAEVKTTKKVKKPFLTNQERLKRKYAKMLSE